MLGRALTAGVPIVLAAALALVAACNGGEATPTATMEDTTATLDMATAPPDIRQQDLTDQPGLQDFLASAGGAVDSNAIIYGDLTEDGVEDAVVPVSSGGEGGDIAVFVFGYGPGGLDELLRVLPENDSLRAEISDSALTIIEPVFGPADPLCCPSELRTTTYRWDGSELVVADQETAPGPGN